MLPAPRSDEMATNSSATLSAEDCSAELREGGRGRRGGGISCIVTVQAALSSAAASAPPLLGFLGGSMPREILASAILDRHLPRWRIDGTEIRPISGILLSGASAPALIISRAI